MPISGGRYPFGPSSSFFSTFFFLPFFVFFLAFYVSNFFGFFSFLHFLFSFFPKKKFLIFFFLVFLSNILFCWRLYQSLTVSSVVGAPWRCGVLTTKGGIAGIGLGRLLGREHASTPQSGVEASRLLKRSLRCRGRRRGCCCVLLCCVLLCCVLLCCCVLSCVVVPNP